MININLVDNLLDDTGVAHSAENSLDLFESDLSVPILHQRSYYRKTYRVVELEGVP